jgi:hypothetical protein
MTLSIEDLRVDSYATQLSELELTELKGGVTPAWLAYVAVAVVGTVGAIVVSAINNDGDHKECDDITVVTEETLPDGTKITTTKNLHAVCRE